MKKLKAVQLGFAVVAAASLSAPSVHAAPKSVKKKPAPAKKAPTPAKKPTAPAKKAAPKPANNTAAPNVAQPLPLPEAPVAKTPVEVAPYVIAPVMVAPVIVAPVKATLPAGTKLQLLLADELKSNKAKVGDEVVYFVKEDVLSPDGKAFIKKGARASGKITAAKGARSLGRKGKLEFTVEEVLAADGTNVLLRSTNEKSGKGRGGVVIAATLLVSIFSPFIKGKNVTIPKDTVIEAYVDNDTSIKPTTEVSPTPLAPQATVKSSNQADAEPVFGTIGANPKTTQSK